MIEIFSKKGRKEDKIKYIEENITTLTPLEKRLILVEDFIIEPYLCSAGVLTVGVGHTKDVDKYRIYTVNDCLKLLKIDITQATFDFYSVFKEVNIPNDKKEPLIDMMFNLGITRFKKFKKMIQAIKDNNWEKASEEAKNSKWYNQVGDRAKRIVEEMI